MTPPISLAYLDHNVLDRMTKGDADGVAELLRRAKLTPVYSSENLVEIRRSTGYEQAFLEVLERIGAWYLAPVLDAHSKHTGNAEIREVRASDTYAAFLKNVPPLPDNGYGPTGLLQKLYGGRQEQSLQEILSAGADELTDLLIGAAETLDEIPELDDQVRSTLADTFAMIPSTIRKQYSSIATQLDALPGSILRQFEQATALGPKVLNNIQRPDVVRKVWKLLQASLPAGSEAVDFETFFGIKPFPFEADADRERTTLEKVNAIYHQLNFVGYYRHSKMSQQCRFVASFSDMTHAALASFCQVLVSGDEDLVMKAAAAYEYLEVPTRIVHYRSWRPIPPPRS